MAPTTKHPVQDCRFRILTVWMIIPTIALSIPHDCLSHRLHLALGIVPMAASALLAIIILTNDKSMPWAFTAVPDAVIAGVIMLVLIPWWVKSAGYGYGIGNAKVLGAYATVPMLFNFTVHAFFALREVMHALHRANIPGFGLGLGGPSRCSDCEREFHAAGGHVSLPVDETEARAATSHHQYGPVLDNGTSRYV